MGLHLESCGLAAVLQQKQLVLTNLSSIEPEAFNQLGCHTTQMSLANSSLVAMPAGRFKHLKCLKILDLGRAKLEELDSDAFVGLEKLELLSMSENLLTNLSAAHLSHLPTLHTFSLEGKQTSTVTSSCRAIQSKVSQLTCSRKMRSSKQLISAKTL